MNQKKFIEQINILEKIFYEFMTDKGYSVNIYEEGDIKYLGYGGIASKDDKFAICFSLVEHPYPKSFSIFANDRNGNFALCGDTVAIYSINCEKELTNDKLKENFKLALKDIYDKYSVYSKKNRLDFVFNELEMERKDYTDIDISKEIEIEDEIEK